MVDRLNDFYYTFESLLADLKEDYEELMCHFTSLYELHQHRHDIIHYSWCKKMADVGPHLLDNDPAFSGIEERFARYFDYEPTDSILMITGILWKPTTVSMNC